MNIQAAKTKIVNCVLSCKTVEQLNGCEKMVTVFKRQYLKPKDFLDVLNLRELIALQRLEIAIKHNYYIGTDPIPDCCEKCGEPINNAEYTICRQCSADEAEYWKDVKSETGCSQYGYDG